MLEAALADIGIGLDRTVHSIRNSWGSDTCDAALTKNGKVTSMGIKGTAKHGLELVGDTFNCNFGHGIYDKGQETLMNKIAQAYQVRHIKYQIMNCTEICTNYYLIIKKIMIMLNMTPCTIYQL